MKKSYVSANKYIKLDKSDYKNMDEKVKIIKEAITNQKNPKSHLQIKFLESSYASQNFTLLWQYFTCIYPELTYYVAESLKYSTQTNEVQLQLVNKLNKDQLVSYLQQLEDVIMKCKNQITETVTDQYEQLKAIYVFLVQYIDQNYKNKTNQSGFPQMLLSKTKTYLLICSLYKIICKSIYDIDIYIAFEQIQQRYFCITELQNEQYVIDIGIEQQIKQCNTLSFIGFLRGSEYLQKQEINTDAIVCDAEIRISNDDMISQNDMVLQYENKNISEQLIQRVSSQIVQRQKNESHIKNEEYNVIVYRFPDDVQKFLHQVQYEIFQYQAHQQLIKVFMVVKYQLVQYMQDKLLILTIKVSNGKTILWQTSTMTKEQLQVYKNNCTKYVKEQNSMDVHIYVISPKNHYINSSIIPSITQLAHDISVDCITEVDVREGKINGIHFIQFFFIKMKKDLQNNIQEMQQSLASTMNRPLVQDLDKLHLEHDPKIAQNCFIAYAKFIKKQELYLLILDAIKKNTKVAFIPRGLTVTQQDLTDVQFNIQLDFPQYWYIQLNMAKTYQNEKGQQTVMQVNIFNPQYDDKYINEMNLKVNEAVFAFLLEMQQKKDATVLQKAHFIHNFLTKSVKYVSVDMKKPYKHAFDIVGALVTKKCVCQGLSQAFKFLCDCSGITSLCVSGKYIESNEKHMWNMVNINGQFYHVDVTADLRDHDSAGFCIPDELAYKNRVVTLWDVPKSGESLHCTYQYIKGLYIYVPEASVEQYSTDTYQNMNKAHVLDPEAIDPILQQFVDISVNHLQGITKPIAEFSILFDLQENHKFNPLKWFKNQLPEIQTQICIQLGKYVNFKKYSLKEQQFLRMQLAIDDVDIALEMPTRFELFQKKTMYILNFKEDEFGRRCLEMAMPQEMFRQMLVLKVGNYLYVRSH